MNAGSLLRKRNLKPPGGIFWVLVVLLAATACKTGSRVAIRTEAKPAAPQPAAPQPTLRDQESTCRAFVQEFYDWYTAQSDAEQKARTAGPAGSTVLRYRPQVFSAELTSLLKADNEAQAKAHELVGLDFDPFFNSQDPSPKFRVKSVKIANGHCTATVNGIREGTIQETVMPELVSENEKWVFVNFHYRYDSGDSNLIEQLKLLAKDREKYSR